MADASTEVRRKQLFAEFLPAARAQIADDRANKRLELSPRYDEETARALCRMEVDATIQREWRDRRAASFDGVAVGADVAEELRGLGGAPVLARAA